MFWEWVGGVNFGNESLVFWELVACENGSMVWELLSGVVGMGRSLWDWRFMPWSAITFWNIDVWASVEPVFRKRKQAWCEIKPNFNMNCKPLQTSPQSRSLKIGHISSNVSFSGVWVYPVVDTIWPLGDWRVVNRTRCTPGMCRDVGHSRARITTDFKWNHAADNRFYKAMTETRRLEWLFPHDENVTFINRMACQLPINRRIGWGQKTTKRNLGFVVCDLFSPFIFTT